MLSDVEASKDSGLYEKPKGARLFFSLKSWFISLEQGGSSIYR